MARLRVPGMVLAVAAVLAACGPTAGHKASSSTPTPTLATAPPIPSEVANSARVLQQAFEAVVQKVNPSVVQIETDQGLGSGIVFDNNGDIVTNAHVVEGANSYTVTDASNHQHAATLVGTYTLGDLAVVHAGGMSVPAATFADSNKVQVGQIAIAIGNPLGLRSSVTEGIVSAVGRTESEGNGVTLPNVIQTSAAINPGNSGGALVDIDGNVIGIPTLAATDPQLGGAAAGIGFAIPSNTVKDIAQQLIQHGHVINTHRAYLGVNVFNLFGGGVGVASVTPGGPAEKAGIRRGDILNAVNGQTIQTIDDLNTAIAALKPGDKATVDVTHLDGSTAKVQVTMGEYPSSAA